MTHYMRAVSGVNQDLVVGVCLPLYLLGAMSTWGLTLAEERKTQKGFSYMCVSQQTKQKKVCLVQSAARDGGFTCQTQGV